MKCAFTYVKLDHSEHVEQHAQGLVVKLAKFFDRPFKAHFTFAHEKYNHHVTVTVSCKDSYLKAEALHENFYAAIEEAIEKIARQLQKKKNKMKHHKHKHPAKELNVVYHEEYSHMTENRGRKIS